MIRRWFPIAALAVMAILAVALFKAKSDAAATRERVTALRGEVAAQRAELKALKAEVTELESPARIEALAETYLDLEPGAAARARNLSEIDAVAPLPPEGAR